MPLNHPFFPGILTSLVITTQRFRQTEAETSVVRIQTPDTGIRTLQVSFFKKKHMRGLSACCGQKARYYKS